MGDLYLAFDPSISRLVALKLLGMLDSAELRERFAREARALAALNHPNIVRIFDTGEFEGSPFIVMEYVRGETLAELIRRRAALSVSQKLKLMEEDLESLAAKDLHELLRAWELKHRHRAAECVTQHTLFRKETRWPGYYYRGDAMKVDDANWHVLTVSRRDPKTGEYTMEKAPCYHLVSENE